MTPKNSRNAKLEEEKKPAVKEEKKVVEEKVEVKEVVAFDNGDVANKAEKKEDHPVIKIS